MFFITCIRVLASFPFVYMLVNYYTNIINIIVKKHSTHTSYLYNVHLIFGKISHCIIFNLARPKSILQEINMRKVRLGGVFKNCEVCYDHNIMFSLTKTMKVFNTIIRHVIITSFIKYKKIAL